MPAAEFRTDHWSGRQVIVASNRSDRPQMVSSEAAPANPSAEHAEKLQDPFLEGREQNTPQESLALRRMGTQADHPGWLLRIVANRYPAVARLSQNSATAALGIHDVVIECPDFRRSWLQFSVDEIVRVLMAWQQRLQQLIQTDGIECIQVFRNQGAAAGASLGHSHSQIVALNRIPRLVAHRLKNADAFLQWRSRETEQGQRIVADDELLVVCPESSWVAGQIRVCSLADSLENASLFHELSPEAIGILALTLRRCLQIVDSRFPGVSFNLILNLPPVKNLTAFPWSIDLMPRTASFAGFELACDVPIVTDTPEASAEAYRSVWAIHSTPLVRPLESEFWPSDYSWIPVR